MWFLNNLARYHRECKAVEKLATEVNWLPVADWKLDGETLCLVADIEAHGHCYPVQMIYPANYPASPPTVRPREVNQHWSSHQYGDGGELCLEWGPDNWHDEITGADILHSAHKLVNIENPKGERALPITAPSRHSLTLGQGLRFTDFRLLADDALIRHTQLLPVYAWGKAQCWAMWDRASVTAFIQKLTSSNAESWCSPTLPSELEKTTTQIECSFFKTTLETDVLKNLQSNLLIDTLEAQGCDVSQLRTSAADFILLVDVSGQPHLFWISNENKRIAFSRLPIHEEKENSRLLPEFSNLATTKVRIVGLGSAGSKIALSLARSGVRDFVLVDHDVFLPENICRHELNWEDIGQHKVDAVARQLKLIARDIKVECHRLKLSGQEATANVGGVLSQLGAGDLIIDATADSITFNQLSTVAYQKETPMVWLEIFAGGIGGLIARFRPNRDPNPNTMRSHLLNYLARQNAPEIKTTADYAATNGEGETLMASSSDVAVIAENVTRLALDILTEREPSDFPYSMYLIGLSGGWIFKEPFYTIPIDFSGIESTITAPILSDEDLAETFNSLTQLISKEPHENLPSKSN